MATKEVKAVPAAVVAESDWFSYDRFLRDNAVSVDKTRYLDDCIAAVRQLGARTEEAAAALREQVLATANESNGMIWLHDLDEVDVSINLAADLIDRAIGANPMQLQTRLFLAYCILQQQIEYLARLSTRLALAHFPTPPP